MSRNEIGLFIGDRFHRFEPVGTFGDNLDIRVARQIFAQDLAGEFLIVNQYGPDFPFFIHDVRASSVGKLMATRKTSPFGLASKLA